MLPFTGCVRLFAHRHNWSVAMTSEQIVLVVHCRGCGHNRAVTGVWLDRLATRLGVAPATAVQSLKTDLRERLKCDTCGTKDLEVSERYRDLALVAEERGGDIDVVLAEIRKIRAASEVSSRRRCRGCGGFAVEGDDLCLRCCGN